MKSLGERSFTFIVNVWEERRDIAGAARLWRGSVVDVRNGSRVYFESLSELCDILEQHSGMTNRSSHRPFRPWRRFTPW